MGFLQKLTDSEVKNHGRRSGHSAAVKEKRPM